EERLLQGCRVRYRARVVAADPMIQGGYGLASAIRRLIHHLVIALARVNRLQDVEIERVLDIAPRIPRREREVDDDRISRVARADFGECLADDLFVLSDARP